jgi:hypothetical protein
VSFLYNRLRPPTAGQIREGWLQGRVPSRRSKDSRVRDATETSQSTFASEVVVVVVSWNKETTLRVITTATVENPRSDNGRPFGASAGGYKVQSTTPDHGMVLERKCNESDGPLH